MPVRGRDGRRFDLDSIIMMMYNSSLRMDELENYIITDYDESKLDSVIDDHTDVVILLVVDAFSKNFIDKRICLKLIDKIEGYYYAFEENLISSRQLYEKLQTEILTEELRKEKVNFLGVFKNSVYK